MPTDDRDGRSGLLLRDAELHGRDRVDIRVSGGRVAHITGRIDRLPGEEVIDCAGAAVLPGLCDHHLHLHALAAWHRSVRCGPPEVTGRAGLAAALATAVPDEHGWIRGVGYTESVAGSLDAAALDLLRGDVPVRVQHRSGAMWMLNSAALNAIGVSGHESPRHESPGRETAGLERTGDGRPTGRIWRADDWLRDRLPPSGPPDLAPVGELLLRHGITAVTDATPDLDQTAIGAITDAMRRGALPQRVRLLGAPLAPPRPGPADPLSLQAGGRDDRRLPEAGPYKIVLADSGLPSYDELTGAIRAAHAAGRAVAVHCVTREALALLLAALGETGTLEGDRVEHAAVVPAELVPAFARLGLRVITQPGFLAHRGDDYLRDVPPADRPDLYRCAGFLRAGVPLGLSSDAPYGPLDPWAIIAAAVERRAASGRIVGEAGERLSFGHALEAYLAPSADPGGPARRVRPGADADLVVLRTPLAGVPGDPDPVRAVLLEGRWALG